MYFLFENVEEQSLSTKLVASLMKSLEKIFIEYLLFTGCNNLKLVGKIISCNDV